MLKTAALALVVLASVVVGGNSAQAGDTMRHPATRIGKIEKGGKMKAFRPTKIGKIIVFGRDLGHVKSVRPHRLPN